MTHSRLTRFITGWISIWMNLLNEWFNDSLKIDSFHYWMNQCLNESLEWMIQWLTEDWLVSLLDESVFEWISWMNDSMTHSRLTRFITGWISVFESISWMNNSMTHSRLTRFITGWISIWMNLLNEWFNDSLEIDSFHYWMNQCFWMNLLNEWFNDSLKIDSFHYWMNQCLNESLELMIQWLTEDSLVSLLDESVFIRHAQCSLTTAVMMLKIQLRITEINYNSTHK